MAVKLLFNSIPQFFDSNGDPASGYKLYAYAAGSSTKQTLYQDSAGSTGHSNPITLNSRGEPPAAIWGTVGLTYKLLLTADTSNDPPSTNVWTIDNVSGINDTTSVLDQWVASGLSPTYVSATSFTLAGDQTAVFHVGRELKTSNTGGTVYSEIVASSHAGGTTTVTVANRSGSLDSGLSSVSYGLISATETGLPSLGDERVCQGRLTLTSGTAVTTADVTAAETVYFTPFRGNKVDLFDGTKWVRYTFSELSLDVPDATQVNDVFLYNNAGALTLEAVAWTNDTTRATALVLQDGVHVKSGSTGRRYIGSFYGTTAGNGQTEDSFAKRYVWNYYNRAVRPMRCANETTDSWEYTLATIRQANANAASQLDFVIGVSEDEVSAFVSASFSNTNVSVEAQTLIGLDSTTAAAAGCLHPYTTTQVVNVQSWSWASWKGFPGIGKHILAWLEYSAATGTTTWAGDAGAPTRNQSGIHGELRG